MDMEFLEVLFSLNGTIILQFYIFLCNYIYTHVFGFIDSNFILICNKVILRHPASVTCVSVEVLKKLHTHRLSEVMTMTAVGVTRKVHTQCHCHRTHFHL